MSKEKNIDELREHKNNAIDKMNTFIETLISTDDPITNPGCYQRNGVIKTYAKRNTKNVNKYIEYL